MRNTLDLRQQRRRRAQRLLGFIACVLLGATLGVAHNRTVARGRTDPAVSTVRTITAPLVTGSSTTRRWASRQLGWLVRGRSMDAEVRRLRAENARLMAENAALREADINVQRLRTELGFAQQLPPKHVAADIISLRPSPSFETLIIDRGSRSGIRLRSIVVAPAGLVGQVYDVAPTTSAVLLLTDSNSAVGAMVQRAESRAIGVCKGNGSPILSLAYLNQDADVRAGDAIISSGLGGLNGVYPKGLGIGTVLVVTNDASGAGRNVRVKPAVDVSRLEEVYVLR